MNAIKNEESRHLLQDEHLSRVWRTPPIKSQRHAMSDIFFYFFFYYNTLYIYYIIMSTDKLKCVLESHYKIPLPILQILMGNLPQVSSSIEDVTEEETQKTKDDVGK
jgi:hypothetical protein